MNLGAIDPHILNHVILPALAGAAGTGALSAYASSNYKPSQESPSERRRRVMRSGLIGAALGGVAGGALPTGIEMLGKPFSEHPDQVAPLADRATDRAIDFGASNAAPLALGTWGGLKLRGQMNANRGKATGQLVDLLKSPESKMDSTTLKSLLATPTGAHDVISRILASGKAEPGKNNPFYANELMQEAGHRGVSLADLEKLSPSVSGTGVRDAFQTQLADKGIVSKMVSKLVGTKVQPAAEAYSRFIRPGIGATNPRIPLPILATLLASGVYGAHKIQDRIAGQ